MYHLACKDLGNETCPFEASAETQQDAAVMMMEHAKMAHPEGVQKMMEGKTEEDVLQAMVAAVREG